MGMSKMKEYRGKPEMPERGNGGIFPMKGPAKRHKERVMGPTISVCRKGDEVYLTLEGDFHNSSSQLMLQALRKLMTTMLKCTAPESPVAYSFKTRCKVNLKNTG